MQTVVELPLVPWIGRLSPPMRSDAQCASLARVLAAANAPTIQAPKTARRASAVLAVLAISLMFLHNPAPSGSLRALVGFEGSARNSSSSGVPEMKRMQSLMAGVLGAGAVAMGAGAQNAVEWRVADGGNGHWYELVYEGHPSWTQAMLLAEQRGGHLATLTSQSESDLAGRLSLGLSAMLLGGYQDRSSPNYAEPGGGWRWVTDEPWVYTNWGTGEPNNASNGHGDPGEDYLSSWTGDQGFRWGDGDNICPGCNPGPFLIEYDADCNNDGLVDYGQILAGDLPDANHNNIPDCCEQGTPCFLTQGLVAHWTLDGTPNDSSGNGHHGLAFNLDPTTDRFGVANAAYHFNGINGYMTAAGVPIPTNNAFSWSLWIKAEEPGVRGPIIERAQAFGVNLT
ncbi:MAG: hypothetical protein WCI96_07015, partial [Planctomycetota bacterium]